MEIVSMCWIDRVLHGLEPIALQHFTDIDFLDAISADQNIPFGQIGFFFRRSHVSEQQPAELNHGVSGMLDFVFVSSLGIFEGLLDAFAAGVVLPTVVGTADAVFLDEAIIKRRAAMRTALADKTIGTTPIAIQHQVL